MRPGIVIIAIWVGWAISWVAAAGWSNRTESRPPVGPEIGYRLFRSVPMGHSSDPGGSALSSPIRRHRDSPNEIRI